MGQNIVPSVATHQALQNRRLASLSAPMWARVERHLAAIQSQPGDILSLALEFSAVDRLAD